MCFILFFSGIIFAPNASLFVFTLCLALAAQNGARCPLTSHCGAGGTSFVLTLNEKPLIEIKACFSWTKNPKETLICSRLILLLFYFVISFPLKLQKIVWISVCTLKNKHYRFNRSAKLETVKQCNKLSLKKNKIHHVLNVNISFFNNTRHVSCSRLTF